MLSSAGAEWSLQPEWLRLRYRYVRAGGVWPEPPRCHLALVPSLRAPTAFPSAFQRLFLPAPLHVEPSGVLPVRIPLVEACRSLFSLWRCLVGGDLSLRVQGESDVEKQPAQLVEIRLLRYGLPEYQQTAGRQHQITHAPAETIRIPIPPIDIHQALVRRSGSSLRYRALPEIQWDEAHDRKRSGDLSLISFR